MFVTHDQEEALELADRVVVMRDGQIEEIGTPDEIYDEPVSPFMFSFIGQSSALPVRVDQGKLWLDQHPLDLPPGNVPNGPARLFLRPHVSTSSATRAAPFPALSPFCAGKPARAVSISR